MGRGAILMLQRSCYCRCAVGPICTDWGEAGSPIILFADHDWDFRPSSSGSFFFCISFVACRLIVPPFCFVIHYISHERFSSVHTLQLRTGSSSVSFPVPKKWQSVVKP